jgi:hypothetical protein
MKATGFARWLSALLLGFAAGCATRDVNPQATRAGRGYVDFYTVPKTEVWWKVDVYDPHHQKYKELTAQFKPPAEGIFRIESRPGRLKARLWFVNQSIEAPAEIEAEVREGMITPIRVTLNEGDSTFVRIVEDRARNVYRNRAVDYEQQRWRISAVAQPPVPYTPKERTAYWK